jgi:hypothetical protein
MSAMYAGAQTAAQQAKAATVVRALASALRTLLASDDYTDTPGILDRDNLPPGAVNAAREIVGAKVADGLGIVAQTRRQEGK